MWPFKRKPLLTLNDVKPASQTRKYRLLKYTNFIEDGRTHYNIQQMGNNGHWTSCNDDYGYRTLDEAEKVLESFRHPRPKQETIVVKEVEYD